MSWIIFRLDNCIKGVAQCQTFSKFSKIVVIHIMLQLLFSCVGFIISDTKMEQLDWDKPVFTIGSHLSVWITSQTICHMVMLKTTDTTEMNR